MMAGYYASLHSENSHKLVLYAPLYNFNDHTNLGPRSGLQNKRKPLEFNFAVGAYRLVPEAANTARCNDEIPPRQTGFSRMRFIRRPADPYGTPPISMRRGS